MSVNVHVCVGVPAAGGESTEDVLGGTAAELREDSAGLDRR